jgi:hypothetical protein
MGSERSVCTPASTVCFILTQPTEKRERLMNRQSKPTNVKKRGLSYSSQPHQRFRAVGGLILLIAVCCCTRSVYAFRVFDPTDYGYGGGILRWDAASYFVDGVERSLDGGLRYSVEGGSYAAFRDQILWAAPAPGQTPTVMATPTEVISSSGNSNLVLACRCKPRLPQCPNRLPRFLSLPPLCHSRRCEESATSVSRTWLMTRIADGNL